MRFIYSQAHLRFLTENFPKLSVEALAAAFNKRFDQDKTPAMIKSTCKNHGIKCYRGKGFLNTGRSLLLTEEQIDFVKVNYPSMTRLELTEALNNKFKLSLKLTQVVAFVKNHGIKSGRTGQYEKGQAPFNAGTKGVMKQNKASFKKGHTPHNHAPVGSTTVDTEGFHKIKVANPDVWEFTHRRAFEKANGPIPESHAVVFIDGDRDNLDLSNLELISRGELGARNKFGVNNLPGELRPIASNIVKIRLKVSEIKKQRKRA